MIRFTDYASIKDNYCLCYFGQADEYLVQLRLLLPSFAAAFPGLNIFLCAKDHCLHHLRDCGYVLPLSRLKEYKPILAHVKELRSDGQEHPVAAFVAECGLTDVAVSVTAETARAAVCGIYPKSSFPTKDMTKEQIDAVARVARAAGYAAAIEPPNWQDLGWVIGTENVPVFEAAAAGIKTSLVETGLGGELFKKLFPSQKLLRL